MANRHLKQCQTPLATRAIQIQTTLSFHRIAWLLLRKNSKYGCLMFLRGTLFQIIRLRLYLESQEGRANSCKCIDFFLMCTGKKGTSREKDFPSNTAPSWAPKPRPRCLHEASHNVHSALRAHGMNTLPRPHRFQIAGLAKGMHFR